MHERTKSIRPLTIQVAYVHEDFALGRKYTRTYKHAHETHENMFGRSF